MQISDSKTHNSPTVTVIIVNHNSGDRLKRTLEHLAAQDFSNFETIVIDNDSQDGSQASATAGPLAVRLIEAGSNLGFAAANNLAARQARGEWLAFLNPDAYPEPGWLAALIAASERYPGADAFGSTQLNAADPDILDGAGDVYHAFGVGYRGHFGWPTARLPEEGECFAPCAAAAMYRRTVFEELGGFDERFFCYFEDVDLGFRLRLAGGCAIQVRDARVLHEGSAISGRRSAFTVYHGNRNRIWAHYKNMPGALYWPLIPMSFAVNIYLLMRAILNGSGAPYLRAMRDGFGGLSAFHKDRAALQASRRASVGELARTLVWSPLKSLRREAVLRAPSKTALTPRRSA